MDSASRHAQRLASNFLDDLDDMQRASRARDRRAMSQLDTGVRSSSSSNSAFYRPTIYGRGYSLPRIRSATPIGRRTSTCYYPPGRSRPVHLIPQYSPPVTMVGKSAYTYNPEYSYLTPVSNYHLPTWRSYVPHNRYWHDSHVYNQEFGLPTSGLRAHRPTIREHILSRKAREYVHGPAYHSGSLINLYDEFDEPISRVRHTTVRGRTPAPLVRLSSVPPQSTTVYRPIYYTSEVGLPPVAPRTYYRSHRYITETAPQHRISHGGPTTLPRRRTYTTQYSTGETPVTHRYAYNYPSHNVYESPVSRSYSYTNLLPEVTAERRRIEGYGQGIVKPSGEQISELRGRIKRLLCRSKHDPHYFRF